MSVTDRGSVRTEPQLDPRGVRFSASLTSVVLALVLISSSGWLAAAQAVVFGVASVAGMRFAPYGVLYRLLLAPRLAPPAEREDAAPVRFSQTVGLVFTEPDRTRTTSTTHRRRIPTTLGAHRT